MLRARAWTVEKGEETGDKRAYWLMIREKGTADTWLATIFSGQLENYPRGILSVIAPRDALNAVGGLIIHASIVARSD